MVDLQPFSAGDFEAAGVESELSEDRGMDVGHVVPVFDCAEVQLVRSPVPIPRLSPPPANQTANPNMWSRPLPPCEPGVQLNSVAETTIVLQTTTGQ